MRGAVLAAVIASIANLLQGWDNATVAGAVLYAHREFELEEKPKIEGLVVAMSLIGATVITTFSGAVSDWIGRRPMLMLSSVLYFVSGLMMLWAPNVYVLLLARLVDGCGIGLAVMLVPLYISETAPSEMRGLLNTLPQFSGCGGLFLSYCAVFVLSLTERPDWRVMLGALSIFSLVYFVLIVFFLPESPRWLTSKGRMLEAKTVLQELRGKEDVSGEMALLVEGLGAGAETSIEDYVIGPANEFTDDQGRNHQRKKTILFGFEEGLSWVAQPVTTQSMIKSALLLAYRHADAENQVCLHSDEVVNLLGCVHAHQPEMGSMRSTLFPNFASMFSLSEPNLRTELRDEEIGPVDGEEYEGDIAIADYDDNLQSPLLSRQTTSMEAKEMVNHGTVSSMRGIGSLMKQGSGLAVSAMGVGGGWQLAWKWSETDREDGIQDVRFKRMYMRQEGLPVAQTGSLAPLAGADIPEQGGYIQATALVDLPALWTKELMDQPPFGPAMLHPSKIAAKGPRWVDLFRGGVWQALFVGIGLQLLQQLAGINGILYYTPQILEQAGVQVLLSNMGIRPDSASLLVCALTSLLMLPCIAVAMRLMDNVGRRLLLLATIPVLIASLLVLVLANLTDIGTATHAALCTIGIIVYSCCFVMGFGPIPSILCSEIFPTCIRGVCITICSLAFWLGNIAVTYTFSLMLYSIGLAGVFAIYATVCLVSLVFVYLKVPETKGAPLEIISNFFAIGANKATRS